MGDQADIGPGPRGRRSVRYALVLSSAVAVLALAFALTSALGSGAPGDLRTASGIGVVRPIDRSAPGFRLPSLSGRGSISLAEYGGDVIVLNFWASWCHPCREEAPMLEQLWKQYRGRSVQFVGIDHRDGRADALAFQR